MNSYWIILLVIGFMLYLGVRENHLDEDDDDDWL